MQCDGFKEDIMLLVSVVNITITFLMVDDFFIFLFSYFLFSYFFIFYNINFFFLHLFHLHTLVNSTSFTSRCPRLESVRLAYKELGHESMKNLGRQS